MTGPVTGPGPHRGRSADSMGNRARGANGGPNGSGFRVRDGRVAVGGDWADAFPALPPEVAARTVATSRGAGVLRLVYAESERRGTGLTVRDVADVLRSIGAGRVKALAPTLSEYGSRGLLAASGRTRHLRWHPPGFVENDAAVQAARSPKDAVVDAVTRTCALVGALTPTALVTQVLRREGEVLAVRQPSFVGEQLSRLAREHRTGYGPRGARGDDARLASGQPARHAPPLYGRLVTTIFGRAARFWGPACAPHLPAPVPAVATREQACVAVVAELLSAVGRPVDRRAVWLHVRALPAESLVRQLLAPTSDPAVGPAAARATTDAAGAPGPDGRHDGGQPPVYLARYLREAALRRRPVFLTQDAPQAASTGGTPGTTHDERAATPAPPLHFREYASQWRGLSASPPHYYLSADGGNDVGPGAGPGAVPGADAMHLDDFLAMAPLADEVAGLGRFERALPAFDANALAPWLRVRRAAVQRAVRALVDGVPGRAGRVRRDAVVLGEQRHGGLPDVPDAADLEWLRVAAEAADTADAYLAALASAEAAGFKHRAADQRRTIRSRRARRRRAVDTLTALMQITTREGAATHGAPGGAAGTLAPAAPASPESPPGDIPALPTSAAACGAPTCGARIGDWNGAMGGGPWLVRLDAVVAAALGPSAAHSAQGRLPTPAYLALAHCRRFQPPVGLRGVADATSASHVRRDHDEGAAPDGPARTPRGTAARTAPPPPPPVLLDRAEALAALGDAQPDVWTRSTLRRAYALVGSVARDHRAFAACLSAAVTNVPEVAGADAGRQPRSAGGERPVGEGLTPALRRRMVVAGGLLGVPEALAAAECLVAGAPEAADGDLDVRAAALGAALVGPDALAALLAGSAVAGLPYGFGERLSKIRRRARAGLLLSVGTP